MICRLLCEAELHATSKVPVLITGESGTGKELLARAIHQSSPRGLATPARTERQKRRYPSAILPCHLPEQFRADRISPIPPGEDLKIVPLSQVEENHIIQVYDQTNHNKSKTAAFLGIGLNTLRRRLNSYNIS